MGETDTYSRAMAAQETRRERAEDIWRTAPNTAPVSLTNSLLGDLFTIVVEDFAQNYKCMRGVSIDPAYVRALRNDVLCALAALKVHADQPSDPEPREG